MSIVLIRDAFLRAAGDRLTLYSILMHYASDRRAQILTVTGAFPNGAKFNAKTEPFNGDVTVIMARAAQLVAEILEPHVRQGAAITHEGEDSDLPPPAPEPEPEPGEQNEPATELTPKPKAKRKTKR